MLESAVEAEESNDLFYFESDHLAVKGNKDYSELLKTLFILQAQQQRAIKDYEEVEKIRQECLRDPLGTVEKLKRGEDLEIPGLQIIAEIPEIDWSKYDVALPEEGLKMLTRNASENTKPKVANNNHKDEKTETHNRPWTTEEQKRLEELLVIYPPEPIEVRRFAKIAAALGNRTVKQVTSRVQKYFLKLYKSGLPIPGRIPKSNMKYKKPTHKHQRLNHFLWRPTTFFPELDVPVKMNETEDIPGPRSSTEAPSTSHANYLIPGGYGENNDPVNKSDTACQIDLLKKVKREKERLNSAETKLAYHFGYKCDFCNEEPIAGTRWHCTTCMNTCVDFCTDCLVTQMYSENSHPLTHRFAAIRGGDDQAALTSDSESNPSTEKNEECSSSGSEESADLGRRREYSLSDLEMDENSNSLPAFKAEGVTVEANGRKNCEQTSGSNGIEINNSFHNTEDTPYNYLCSVINSEEFNEDVS